MRGKTKEKVRGLTAMELLVSLAIVGAVAYMGMTTLISFSNFQSIDKDADVVVSYVEKARNQTINAKDDDQYGIKFATSSITLFKGTAYSAGAGSNQVYAISNKVRISSIQLTGGATALYFMPITGKPNATGTVTFVLNSNASTTKTVTIYGSGLAEVQ